MGVYLCITYGTFNYHSLAIAQSNSQFSRRCFTPMPEMLSSNALVSSGLHRVFEEVSDLIEDLIS